MDIKYAYIGTKVYIPMEGIQGKIIGLKMSESGLNRVYATIETDKGDIVDKPLDLLVNYDFSSNTPNLCSAPECSPAGCGNMVCKTLGEDNVANYDVEIAKLYAHLKPNGMTDSKYMLVITCCSLILSAIFTLICLL